MDVYLTGKAITSHEDDTMAASGGEEALVANIQITVMTEVLSLLQGSLGLG